ncbi:MAG: hypothetical protein ACUVWN_16155 [bacterium]
MKYEDHEEAIQYGVITTLFIAGKDDRIDSLILLEIPVPIDDPFIDRLEEKSVSSYRLKLANYIKNQFT